MAVITNKDLKLSSRFKSIQIFSEKFLTKFSRLFGRLKKLFLDILLLFFTQKSEPLSQISKKEYLKHQNSVERNINYSMKILH